MKPRIGNTYDDTNRKETEMQIFNRAAETDLLGHTGDYNFICGCKNLRVTQPKKRRFRKNNHTLLLLNLKKNVEETVRGEGNA